MTDYTFLYKDELVILELRRLFETYGYNKFQVNRFETYDFYAKNRDFLVDQRVITFTDTNGRLLALKPDVTLSIVKNTDDADPGRKKLYYTENVYREAKDIHELKEIFQLGLEVIGNIDRQTTAEVVTLAKKSLNTIHKNNLLTVSHMDYLRGLLDCFSQDPALRAEILDLFTRRNVHDLARLCEANGLNKTAAEAAFQLLSPNADRTITPEKIERLALNDTMRAAARELTELFTQLHTYGADTGISVDPALAKDPGYYSGIILQGYVEGVPSEVLSGGRYDNLLKKMDKTHSSALGFALYFDRLNRTLHQKCTKAKRAVILYDEASLPGAVCALQEKLQQHGVPFITDSVIPQDVPDGTVIYRVDHDKITEERL